MKKTSIEAHESIKPHKPTQKQIILETMQRIGKPCTPEQISENCSLGYIAIQRRMSEIKKDGHIIETEHKRKNQQSQCGSVIWQLRTNQLNLF